MQDLKELEEEKKELENQAKGKTGNNSYINKDTNNSVQNNDNTNQEQKEESDDNIYDDTLPPDS